MKEHDFRKMAYAIKNLHSVPSKYGEVVEVRRAAYAAGLEHAAEIAREVPLLAYTTEKSEMVRDIARETIARAIRAEKEADHD